MGSRATVNRIAPATPPLDERSKHLRRLIVRALDGGGRGHIGSSMSLVEIMRVLYDDVLRYRPSEPKWHERDRMILSKGHGCLALYVLLADKGFIPVEALDTFCRRDSILGGHPEAAKIPGVEASTGSLGHGLSFGLGMALAARIERRDTRVFVVMGDGEINEGSVWEAAHVPASTASPTSPPSSTTTRSSRQGRLERSRISSHWPTSGAPSDRRRRSTVTMWRPFVHFSAVYRSLLTVQARSSVIRSKERFAVRRT